LSCSVLPRFVAETNRQREREREKERNLGWDWARRSHPLAAADASSSGILVE